MSTYSARRSESPSLDPSDPRSFKRYLEAACRADDLVQVDTILRTWTSSTSLPSPTPNELSFALTSTVLNGNLPIIRLLLAHKAEITSTTAIFATRDDTPNSLAIFEILLQHGWSPQSAETRLGHMIMNSVYSKSDSKNLLQWFLDHGAPPNGLPSDPGSPIRWAVNTASSPEIPSLLISHGASLKHTSALHVAAYRRGDDISIAMMKCLLKAGVDINEQEYEGWAKLPREAASSDWGTALHETSKVGSVARARFLVEMGVDLARKSKYDYTARDTAQLYGKEDVKNYLEAVMRKRGMEFKDVEIEEEESEDEE